MAEWFAYYKYDTRISKGISHCSKAEEEYEEYIVEFGMFVFMLEASVSASVPNLLAFSFSITLKWERNVPC